MTTLRRAIRHWLQKVGWRKNTTTAAGERLARDLGLPPEQVSHILERTAAELRQLAESDESADARPVVQKAIDELATLGVHARPFDEAALDRCLSEIPEQDLAILSHFKQGMKHRQIADLMGLDLESVRSSLVRTYSELRMKMMSDEDDGGSAALVVKAPRKVLRAIGRY